MKNIFILNLLFITATSALDIVAVSSSKSYLKVVLWEGNETIFLNLKENLIFI